MKVQFQPFNTELMDRSLGYLNQVWQATQDAIMTKYQERSQLRSKLQRDMDSEQLAIFDRYMKAFEDLSDASMQSMTPYLRKDLWELDKQFNNEVILIEDATKNWDVMSAKQWQQRAQNPSDQLFFNHDANKTSLSTLKKDPSIATTYITVSGNSLKTNTANAVKDMALRSQHDLNQDFLAMFDQDLKDTITENFSKIQGDKYRYIYRYFQGLNRGIITKFLNGELKDSDVPGMSQLHVLFDSIIKQQMRNDGATKENGYSDEDLARMYNIAAQGLYATIGKEEVQILGDQAAINQAELNRQKAYLDYSNQQTAQAQKDALKNTMDNELLTRKNAVQLSDRVLQYEEGGQYIRRNLETGSAVTVSKEDFDKETERVKTNGIPESQDTKVKTSIKTSNSNNETPKEPKRELTQVERNLYDAAGIEAGTHAEQQQIVGTKKGVNGQPIKSMLDVASYERQAYKASKKLDATPERNETISEGSPIGVLFDGTVYANRLHSQDDMSTVYGAKLIATALDSKTLITQMPTYFPANVPNTKTEYWGMSDNRYVDTDGNNKDRNLFIIGNQSPIYSGITEDTQNAEFYKAFPAELRNTVLALEVQLYNHLMNKGFSEAVYDKVHSDLIFTITVKDKATDANKFVATPNMDNGDFSFNTYKSPTPVYNVSIWLRHPESWLKYFADWQGHGSEG